jgi:hypothetical protein
MKTFRKSVLIAIALALTVGGTFAYAGGSEDRGKPRVQTDGLDMSLEDGQLVQQERLDSTPHAETPIVIEVEPDAERVPPVADLDHLEISDAPDLRAGHEGPDLDLSHSRPHREEGLDHQKDRVMTSP